MINGLHAMIFSTDAAADRAFLRDVLGFPYVDSGGEWLIFKMPPAEIGVHPGDCCSERLLESIQTTFRIAARSRRPSAYSDLAG